MPMLLRRALRATQHWLAAICEPAASAFSDSVCASTIFAVMMLS